MLILWMREMNMFDKFKIKLTENKKNIAKISSGTLIGQGISLITLPIITRLYGPEIIGIWTLLNSIAMIVKSYSDLGMTNSIMVDDDKDVESTYTIISSIVVVLSILSSIVITSYFVLNDKLPEINGLFLFLFIIIIIITTQQIQVCYTWLNRKGEYSILMKNPVLNTGIYGVVAIILGVMGFKTYGYFIGHMFGLLITFLHMKRNLPRELFNWNFTQYKVTFKRNERFIKLQMPTNILANLKNQLPVLLVQGLWGTEILGYYSVTVRLLQTPSTLLANAIGRVFFQTTTQLKREGKPLGRYVYQNIRRGMIVGIFPMILLMGFGDVAAVIFLGEDWIIAGDFIRILTLQYFFMFLMNAVRGLEITLEKQNLAMYSIIAQIFGYLSGAYIGKIIFDDIYVALIIMSIFFIIINIIYFSALFKTIQISIKKYLFSAITSILVIAGSSFVIRWVFNELGVI